MTGGDISPTLLSRPLYPYPIMPMATNGHTPTGPGGPQPMTHHYATITRADMIAADDATRTFRFDLAHQVIGEACNAARDAIGVLEELPHADWIWQVIEEIDQAAERVRSVIPEDNLESLTLFVLSLGGRLEHAMGQAYSFGDSDSHASDIGGYQRVVDALARVAPIASRPSTNTSSPLSF